MVDDLIIEKGNLEVLRNRTRDMASRLQSVSVATAGDYISSGAGGSELAGLGRNTGKTIDDAVMATSRDLDDFSQSVNDPINTYNATGNDTTVAFRQIAHGDPAMTMSDLRRKMEEQ